MRPKKTNRALAAFGQSVRAYRKAMDMSQEELAHAAELHVSYLGTVERGEKNISLLSMLSISQALGIPPSALVAVLDAVMSKPLESRKRNSE
jgi:transcriptional regulator with XRE-family HTH domain